jgi:cytochrome c551
MKAKLATLLLGTSLMLAACGGGDDAADNNKDNGGGATASAGEQVYQQSCASCHGQNLQGQVGPNLEKVGSKYSKDDILQIIEKGRGGMPGGLAKGEDAEKVAEWLASKK